MAAVDFLHYENPPTWAGVEPVTLGAESQRQTNHATQQASIRKCSSFDKRSIINFCIRIALHWRRHILTISPTSASQVEVQVDSPSLKETNSLKS
ncbi:hypothetical protein TNCV_675061 [Trichonephila clavipes]|nr:hypothetical protein TNCV_675061 [Trichonephila clavipes]